MLAFLYFNEFGIEKSTDYSRYEVYSTDLVHEQGEATTYFLPQ